MQIGEEKLCTCLGSELIDGDLTNACAFGGREFEFPEWLQCGQGEDLRGTRMMSSIAVPMEAQVFTLNCSSEQIRTLCAASAFDELLSDVV